MAQSPYARVEAQLDSASAEFNDQSHRANSWLLGGLICFGLGVLANHKVLMGVGLAFTGIAQGARLDARDHCQHKTDEAAAELAAIDRDKLRMERAMRSCLPDPHD